MSTVDDRFGVRIQFPWSATHQFTEWNQSAALYAAFFVFFGFSYVNENDFRNSFLKLRSGNEKFH
jgi:hypothetical protein